MILFIDFDVQGNILTTNENRNVIIFDAKDNNNNYDVAYCALERDLENTPLFFKDYYQNSSDLQNVLKLYLQPINTNSLVMVEIFLTNDVVINFLENYEIPYDSKEANLHQSWFVKYYNAAIDYATLDLPQPQSNYSYVSRDYSKAYMVGGEYVLVSGCCFHSFLPPVVLFESSTDLMLFSIIEISFSVNPYFV